MSFKKETFQRRETAILDAATYLFGSKGYDLMTMNDVANAVGIAKPSLYKHFKSKEDLAAAALSRLIDQALAFLQTLPEDMDAYAKLKSLLTWGLQIRIDGGMPFLPSTNAPMREMLMRNQYYISRILQLNALILGFIQTAKQQKMLNSELPDEVILFNYYARSCDPTLDYLRLYSQLSPKEILNHLEKISFSGVC